MFSPNIKKSSQWVECGTCFITILSKDVEKHSSNCPIGVKNYSHGYIKNKCLVGEIGVKENEIIKGLDFSELENFVFLSPAVLQLCSFSIGDWVILEIENMPPIMKKVWPTKEKSLTSILLLKSVLDLNFGETKSYPCVTVRRMVTSLKTAQKITIMPLRNVRALNLNQDIINRLKLVFRDRILVIGNKIGIFYFGKLFKFLVSSISDLTLQNETQLDDSLISKETYFEICDKTEWVILGNQDFEKHATKQCSLSEIGGLSREIEEIKKILQFCLGLNDNLPLVRCTKSVLLYGTSGTGKTMLANAISEDSGMNVVSISVSDLYMKYSSSPEEILKNMFHKALDNSPSVIILDEVDLLCPIRTKITEAEKRIVSTFLVLLDNLHDNYNAKTFLIATTSKMENIDPCFRRYGRFEREIEIPSPNPKARKDILQRLLQNISHIENNDLEEIALNTHGFVGADLVSLCSQAAINASQCGRLNVELDDVKCALDKVKPSAMREVQIESPNIKWSDIGGQQDLKLVLKQTVEWPLKHSKCFQKLGITPRKGVLMYGPPGCSKTMIAKALATESGLNFLSIKGPELFSKWVGESERAVRELFRKARQVSPSIIFFDEIDALGGERSSGNSSNVQERVLAQLLTELDGVTSLNNVTILAATNRPDRIDKALLRPGRLDRIIYVSLPDEETRSAILKLKLSKMPILDVNIEALVTKTDKYSGAEIIAVCHEAAMKALEEDINSDVIKIEHFESALKMIVPRTPKYLLDLYEEYLGKNI